MSDKLDVSLDDILKARRADRAPRGRRGVRHVRGGNRPAPSNAKTSAKAANPTTRIQKSTRANTKAATGTSGGNAESKIIVSNLPGDVTETQIKDYFTKSVGPVKKVTLTYGPNGVSRGICTIVFSKAGSAAQAAESINGLQVDKRPMKVEVIVGASQAPAAAPAKSLGDRIAKPKSATNTAKAQPKSANARTGAGAKNRGGRGGRKANQGNRPKPKTADELDAEMTDYFGGANGANGATETDGAAVQTNGVNGGDIVEDEIQ
ncbi:MAG: hypothetical protein M1822_008968 [Bathelium mastoideum]|nr:MAG: hypothetical protein M1822_008968 [Bathelium mastoideum]